MDTDKYILNQKHAKSSIVARLLDIQKEEHENNDNTSAPIENPYIDFDMAELDEFIKNNL